MHKLIETPKLGPVAISHLVVAYFKKQRDYLNDTEAAKEVIAILQSNEIEQLEIPALIKSRMLINDDSTPHLEFWLHSNSSMIFLVNHKDSYKLVSLALEKSIESFTFRDG
tara:strand:+ start:56 stop:388 length:333 start_codon:yes stop_codon:yes gene_type:complete